MIKTTSPDENTLFFELSKEDLESAVRHFICACHPETATGFVINPQDGAYPLQTVSMYLAEKQ